MNQPHEPDSRSFNDIPLTTSAPQRHSPLVRIGGALGIAASIIGLGILLAACGGMNKVLTLSIIPVALAAPGLILTVIGAIVQKDAISEDTHVLAAVFANICGLIGGLMEMSVWLKWHVFHIG